MTHEELSRVLPAMGIQSDFLSFFIDKPVDKEPCEPFCNGMGTLQVPISLENGLWMDEKNGDGWFLAIGGHGERGCHFRRKPNR